MELPKTGIQVPREIIPPETSVGRQLAQTDARTPDQIQLSAESQIYVRVGTSNRGYLSEHQRLFLSYIFGLWRQLARMASYTKAEPGM